VSKHLRSILLHLVTASCSGIADAILAQVKFQLLIWQLHLRATAPLLSDSDSLELGEEM